VATGPSGVHRSVAHRRTLAPTSPRQDWGQYLNRLRKPDGKKKVVGQRVSPSERPTTRRNPSLRRGVSIEGVNRLGEYGG